MKAEVRYGIRRLPHPWNEKQRRDNVEAWCLVREVVTENGSPLEFTPVAIFNVDSEAGLFVEHVRGGGGVTAPHER